MTAVQQARVAQPGVADLVRPLAAVGRGDLGRAGGKGANLGELVRAGFSVPEGFVVTTEAFPRGEQDPEPSRDLAAAITSAYAALGSGPVAVRSSATAEDLPGAAFAGQQDTELNVAGSTEVLAAVRRCWASVWTERAVAYREARGVDHDAVRMAVVVQLMVDAEVAGVLFTADPVTGDRDTLVVDAAPGLGEAVVGGDVTPDHYLLDRAGRVRERVLSGADSGLTDPVLAELVGLGRRVADLFGRPQDIEWAYADGRVWLLQARPMTALPPPVELVGRLPRRMLGHLLEYVPVRPYPIDLTTWWPYGPAGRMGDVVRHFGVVGVFETVVHEEHGVVDRLVAPRPRLTWRVLATPVRVVALARRHDPARWAEDPRFGAFREAVAELDRLEVATVPWPELLRVPRRALDLVEPGADLRLDYLPGSGLAVLRLLVVLALLRRRSLLPDLLGGARTRTTALNAALEDLADLVRADPGLAAAVDRVVGGAAEDWSAYEGFGTALAAFRAEFGHRETATVTLMTPPTLGEDAQVLLSLVQVLAASPRSTRHAADPLAELLGLPVVRRFDLQERVAGWVLAARTGITFREDSHFWFTLSLPALRRSVLEIGRRLATVGVTAEPADVFHLRLEELEALAAVDDVAGLSSAERHRLAGLVADRATRRAELAGVPLVNPLTLADDGADPGDALVTGTPAGGGSATGPVRVIRTPQDFGRLAAGDVLVCPYTNPAWTPLFPRAAAVVVDTGSMASHAAIVAREYGLPAVMGTRTGTATLTDGQRVTVDGSTGRVTAAAAR